MSTTRPAQCPVSHRAKPTGTGRRGPDVPVYEEDIYSEPAIRDPYPHYAALRALGPVVWLEKQRLYALARYAEVKQVLAEDEIYRSRNGVGLNPVSRQIGKGSTLLSDGSVHETRRQLLAHRLTPRRLRPMHEQVDTLAEQTVLAALTRPEVDGVDDIALKLPLTVVPDLVGWPHRHRDKLVRWAGAIFDILGPFNRQAVRALPAGTQMLAFVHQLARRRDVLPGSMADEVIQAVDRGEVRAWQVPSLFIDYLAPSIDTTASAIASALWLFAIHPEQWTLLRETPSLVPNAVNEVVRRESPLRAFGRIVESDTTLSGTRVPAGARMLVMYASANRDETFWTDPDRFDITRDASAHVGFGYGVHGCAGQGLARMETQAILRALLRHVEQIELTGTPEPAINNVIHRFERLPLHLVPRSKS